MKSSLFQKVEPYRMERMVGTLWGAIRSRSDHASFREPTGHNVLLFSVLAVIALLHSASAAAESVTVRLRDGTGAPVPVLFDESSVYVSCLDSRSGYTSSQNLAPGEHEGTVQVTPGAFFSCGVSNRRGLRRSVPNAIYVTEGAEHSVDVTLTQLEQSLDFSFNQIGSLSATPSYARVRCQSLSNGETYEAELTEPLSQFNLPVEAGSYECTFEGEEQFVFSPRPLLITVPPGQSVGATVRVHQRDTTLRVELITESSQPAVIGPDEPGYISCRATIEGQVISFYQPIETNASSGEISLVGGIAYKCEVGGVLDHHAEPLYITPNGGGTTTLTPRLHPMLSTIRLQLAGPGGSALAGLPSSAPVLVSCVDADGELPDISKFASVNDQQILMQVPVGRWSCSISEIQGFHRRKMPDNSVFTRAGETTDYPITLEAQQYSVTLVLQDQNGASITIPESPSEAYARCVGSEEDLSKTLLPGASSVSFQVVGSDTYKCSVRNVAGYIDASLAITVGSQGASSHDVILPTSEGLLTLSVSKANQEGAYTSLQPISLSARSLAAQQLVTRVNLLSGFSASVVPLSAPGLVCAEAEIQGEATSIYRGTVSSGQHQTASIEVLPPDSTLFVKLVDNSGHQIPISGTIRAIVEAESDNFSYRNTLGFTAGSAMANVRGGATYRVTLLPPAEGEHFYFQNRTFGLSTPSISLAVQPSQINEVSFELAEETEIVTINGTASGGFLTFFHGSSFGSVARNIEVVKPLTQVKVPPGDHSLVYRGGTSALPQLIPFSVGSGKVNEITLKTYKADTLVSIAPRFVSSFRGTTSCNAFSDDGVVLLPKSSNRPDQTIQLALSTSSTDWTIDCSAWSFDNQKRYHGRSAHLVDPSSTEPIAINLHEVGTVEQATASSDTSEQLAVTAGAGVSVFAPRFTFGHANVVTLALDSRVHAPSSQSVAPVKAFRLTARGPQDEPLTPIKSLMMELTLEEDMAVYGYSDLLGYVPLRRQRAQLEIAPVGQLGLHSFAIPPDLVNNGLVVITKEGSDGGAKDTPEIGPSPDPNRDLPRPSQVSLRPPGKVWLRSKRMGRNPTRWTLRARWSATTGPADCYRVVIIGRKGRFKRAYRVPIKAARTKSFQKLRPGRYLVKVQSISNRRGSAYASAKKWLHRR